jgi:hypothetical protein
VLSHLPTFRSGSWTVTSFRDSLNSELITDRESNLLRLYAYAVTESGWNELRSAIIQWKNGQAQKKAIAYIGTDHAITAPQALKRMVDDGVQVRLMKNYSGVFHPKVFWLLGGRKHQLWVGSNNLTRDGLLNNIEFAIHIISEATHPAMEEWHRNVDLASIEFSEDLLRSYSREKQIHEEKARGVPSFTWSQKEERSASTSQLSTPISRARESTATPGRLEERPRKLIVEVMPRETSKDGKQVQIPKEAAISYFDCPAVAGKSIEISVCERNSGVTRNLRLTYFGNTTFRISVDSLEFSDRPCMIVFQRRSDNEYEYEIIARSIFPGRYRDLMKLCVNRTNKKSKRWVMCN